MLASNGSDGILGVGHSENNRFSLRKSRNGLRLWVFTGLIVLSIFLAITGFRPLKGVDKPQCRPIYMYPSYARIDGFDERYTKLAKKYHLFLYREQGIDKMPLDDNQVALDGIPVLFIPGNAGSYKQVRSIAAASSYLYSEKLDSIENVNTKNLDFFAADFNEDFTAFHGRTMLDQAEYLNDAIRYILSLYEQSNDHSATKPQSVIIVAHSMGGIVARVIPTLKNYIDGSINTILTLSSPHAAAPVTFDGDILKIYQQINDFWRNQFANGASFFSKNILLVSITGGIQDTILPADFASVEDVIPSANGFTTYTTTIPGVWTPIDHLAIVWCDQLRQVMAKLLLELVDYKTSSMTRSLKERMDVSKKLLLSGFEDEVADITPEIASNEIIKLDQAKLNDDSMKSYKFSGKSNEAPSYATLNLKKADTLFFLSNIDDIKVYFCLNSNKEAISSNFNCTNTEQLQLQLPADYTDPDKEDDVKKYKMLKVDTEKLQSWEYLVMEFPNNLQGKDDSFVFATVEPASKIVESNYTPYTLSVFGRHIDVTGYSQHIKFNNLWDSLVSYKLRTKVKSKGDLLFPPFIRQWIKSPLETKWHHHILEHTADVNMYNVVPFVPLEETHDRSLNLEIYSPANSELKIEISVNWALTLKMIFIRYRLAIGTFPLFVIGLTMALQFQSYNKMGQFPDFKTTLAIILAKYGYAIVIGLVLLNPLVNNTVAQKLLFMLDPIRLNRPFDLEEKNFHANYYYLGLRSLFMSGLGIAFFLITVSVLTLLHDLLSLLESVIKKCRQWATKKEPATKNMISKNLFDKKRVITSLLLILIVVYYIPYQLAYAIVLVIQLATYIKVCIMVPTSSTEYNNLKNFNLSLLILLIFVTTINAPIIIVFLHNLMIRWETPFRSHHNILAIAPMIFLVSCNSTFNMPRFKSNKIFDGGPIVFLLLYLSAFALVYGMRNLYWLHHIVNVLSGWLLVGYLNK